ncbi:MAG: MobF family relaxase [Acidiferrobacterales bacterium]
MLSLKNLKGSGAAVAAYGEHRTNDRGVGYYAEGAPSAWYGQGAGGLNLRGAVERDTLVAVLQGHLTDGTDLTRRGNRAHDRRLGVDLTFSAPKSVSLAGLACGDERVLAAHDRAVRRALDFIEREVVTARRGQGGTAIERTGSMLAATYQHEDARGVNGHVDPQLHTHSILVNATQRGDGAWSAMNLDFGAHNVRMHTADAVYKSALACELETLGYVIRRTPTGFELAHITDAQIQTFSARKAQIDEALKARGLTRAAASAETRSNANLATREDKKQTDRAEQRWSWRNEARAAGIALDRPQVLGRQTADLSAEAVRAAARHLGERQTVFSRDAIRLEALRAGVGATDLDGIDRAIATRAGGLMEAGADRFTTRNALHREQEILHRARAGRGQSAPLMTPAAAQAYITRREETQGFPFSHGQRAALALRLSSPDRMIGVVGAAGAGKTTSLAGLAEAAREHDLEVIGIAPSAAAAHALQSAGADETRTLAALLAGGNHDGDQRFYILDEAGMVSARDMDILMQRIDAEGARLLLVGDPRQLAAVEAGSPFQVMLDSVAITHARIDEIQRQRDPALRKIAQHFARGEAGEAVALARPYVQEVLVDTPIRGPDGKLKPTAAERREAIAQAVARDYLARDKAVRANTLVVSGTHAVRGRINERIHAGLRERGEIGCEDIPIQALKKADLTRERATQAESYREGMVVRLQEGWGRKRHTIDYTVSGVEGTRVRLSARDGREKHWDPGRERAAGVYDSQPLTLSVGDEIVFRENGPPDGQRRERIRNGDVARIMRIEDGKPVAQLQSGREITLDPTQGQTLDYGWCRTIHSAQGCTVDHVIVAGEACRVATAETAYVAASRQRDSLTIVTDRADVLEKHWAKWAEREHAIAATCETATPDLSPLQSLRAEAERELGREGDLARAREAGQSWLPSAEWVHAAEPGR